jgi:hypothetical protein
MISFNLFNKISIEPTIIQYPLFINLKSWTRALHEVPTLLRQQIKFKSEMVLWLVYTLLLSQTNYFVIILLQKCLKYWFLYKTLIIFLFKRDITLELQITLFCHMSNRCAVFTLIGTQGVSKISFILSITNFNKSSTKRGTTPEVLLQR